jgi:phosphoglycerate dehydrogenase-like enzyme
MVLPKGTHDIMFKPEDLGRLKEAAEVFGPFDRNDLSGISVALSEATAVVTGWASPKFDELLLKAAPKLKLIAHSAGSVKPIVTTAVYDRGIKVTTSAGGNALPVAQFAISMMVSLLKQVPWMLVAQTRGDRDEILRRIVHVRDLMDISVGLIGASRVGREVARLLKLYPNIDIKMYDPYLSQDDALRMGVKSATLDEVCCCEVISIHAPSTPETRHMINSRTLALMPDHAVLINTARGSLVDETALVEEVRKRPLYVLLDVTDPEPPALDSPLRRESNIILTPHIAGAMRQGRFHMGRMAIDQVLRFLRGERLDQEVTREMLATQA